MRLSHLAAALLATPALANTDKLIFSAPPASLLPLPLPLPLPNLSPPAALRLRTLLARVFPPPGQPAWFLLANLEPSRRYELRLCWSALQPSAFTLDVFDPDALSQDPPLLQSLTEYASAAAANHTRQVPAPPDDAASAVFLRVRARADYFSHIPDLMSDPPPPVLVDLVLDPYVFNVLPRSLLPTLAYLVGLGVVAWFLARWIASRLVSIAGPGNSHEKKKQN